MTSFKYGIRLKINLMKLVSRTSHPGVLKGRKLFTSLLSSGAYVHSLVSGPFLASFSILTSATTSYLQLLTGFFALKRKKETRN